MTKTLMTLLVILTACAVDAPPSFVGTTDDQLPVEISVDGEFLTAEVGTDHNFAGAHSFGLFRLASNTGAVLEGVLDDRIIGSFTDADGGLVDFTATELDESGFGEITQATSTTTTATGCCCNTTYHRVYCRKTDGSWYWSGSYC